MLGFNVLFIFKNVTQVILQIVLFSSLLENCDCSVSHVQVLGGSLSPPFNVDILQPSGMFVLKRDQLANHQPVVTSGNESQDVSDEQRGLGDIQRIVTILRAQGVGVVEDEWDEDEYDIDDIDPEFAL